MGFIWIRGGDMISSERERILNLITQFFDNNGNSDKVLSLFKSNINTIYDVFVKVLWETLNSSEREQLSQLVYYGPVYDGDILCKKSRTNLVNLGLATRLVMYNEDGYNAATYRGRSIMRYAENTEPGKWKFDPLKVDRILLNICRDRGTL